MKKMVVSIDLDTICHCRWASGAGHSKWPDARAALRAVYGKDTPGEEFTEAIMWTLDLFDQQKMKATFFILSEVAEMVPEAVREIARRGHEIALHGMYHVDNSRFSADEFRHMIRESRRILQDISGAQVLGYRAPNLIMDIEKLKILEEEGFLYDSSICPSRKFFGKYSNMSEAPDTPYLPSAQNIASPGGQGMVELPIPVFPVIRIPATVGIMTRVISPWWTRIALAASLRKNYGMYYFHPYEVALQVPIKPHSFYTKLFLRNIGRPLRKFLNRYLSRLQGRVQFVTCQELAREVKQQSRAHVTSASYQWA